MTLRYWLSLLTILETSSSMVKNHSLIFEIHIVVELVRFMLKSTRN